MPYDVAKSFTPIARVSDGPFGFVVQTQPPFQSIRDLVAAARAKPGTINYGSGGTASTSQFAGELIKITGKVDIQNIAYTGLPAAIAAVMGGQIDVAIADLPAVTRHVRGGRLRMLAVSSAQRIASMPEVPTVSESGLPGYEVTICYGLPGPPACPSRYWTNYRAPLPRCSETRTSPCLINLQHWASCPRRCTRRSILAIS